MAWIKTLPTNRGGTGLSSPGASGNVLTSNGTIWTSAAPATSLKYTLSTQNANFTASGASGTYYLVTTSGGAVTATLPASPADGTVLKFKCLDAANNLTLQRSSSDVIDNAGDQDTTLVITSTSGVVEVIAVSGRWDVT